MSGRENFLARWSRRKRQDDELAPEQPTDDAPVDAHHLGQEGAPESEQAVEHKTLPLETNRPLFDPATLPSIDSIAADTDIRPFLATGVPAELTRAALRRAWAADPKIRDFVGLADYAWDFHTPGAMPGFGPLEMTAALRSQIADMITGAPSPQPEAIMSAAEAPETTGLTASRSGVEQGSEPGDRGSLQDAAEEDCAQDTACQELGPFDATQNEDAPHAKEMVQRTHGGALPRP